MLHSIANLPAYLAESLHCLKKRFVSDYHRRLHEYDSDSSDEQQGGNEGHIFRLKLESVGFEIQDRFSHHTDKYELKDKDTPTPIFRRGQTFSMHLTFNHDYNPEHHVIHIIVSYGNKPSFSKGTMFKIPLSREEESNPAVWGAWIEANYGSTLKLKIQSPVKCQVGLWKYAIEVENLLHTLWRGAKTIYNQTEHLFYILFNPWLKEDSVFVEDEAAREEYVLCDHANLFTGTYKQPSANHWVFGQFDFAVLPAVILLLEHSRLQHSERGSAVEIARALSALIHANDGHGLLLGKWSEKLCDGTAPDAWSGSTAIFEEYLKTGGVPVKYGQCWVFAGCLTTACRALGIPCRTITCFNSAHDTDQTLTVDTFYDVNGHVLSRTHDSVWNYHCWNEVWTTRPDLPGGYDGWQSVDATHQEKSKGEVRQGPAPVRAVLEGQVGLKYNVDLMFSQVNADMCSFQVDNKSPWGFALTELDTNWVGKLIVTQSLIRSSEQVVMEDVTSCYKYPEGSTREREIFYKAVNRSPKAQKFYELVHRLPEFKDVEFEIGKISSITFGDAFDVSLTVENHSDEVRTVDASLEAHAELYTGSSRKAIKKGDVEVVLSPKEKKTVKLSVNPDEYQTKLGRTSTVRMTTVCRLQETRQIHRAHDVFEVIKAKLGIGVPKSTTMDSVIEAEFSFKNPFDQELTNCSLLIEGPGLLRPKTIKLSNLQAGEQMKSVMNLVPRRPGSSVLVGVFHSDQLTGVRGSETITVGE